MHKVGYILRKSMLEYLKSVDYQVEIENLSDKQLILAIDEKHPCGALHFLECLLIYRWTEQKIITNPMEAK